MWRVQLNPTDPVFLLWSSSKAAIWLVRNIFVFVMNLVVSTLSGNAIYQQYIGFLLIIFCMTINFIVYVAQPQQKLFK